MCQLTEAEAKSLFDECPEYWSGSFKVEYDMFIKHGVSSSLTVYIHNFGKSKIIDVLHEVFDYDVDDMRKALSIIV